MDNAIIVINALTDKIAALEQEKFDLIRKETKTVKGSSNDLTGDELYVSQLSKLKKLDPSIFCFLDERWRFAAVNVSGALILSTYPIETMSGSWIRKRNSGELINCGSGYDASNWKDSLIERNSKELSGSDLTRKMLADGTDMVNCYVSDDSDYDALNDKDERTIMGFSDGWFHTNSVASWTYAVPINNQGEPLTASEVGL